MKSLLFGAAAFLAGALLSNADPTNTCATLVGTYADPQSPEKPILTVAFTNGQFGVTDATGKKTIVSTTPTEKGLVFVEDPRDRNVFRLSASAKPSVYLFEHLGHHKSGTPLPEESKGRIREMVRVQAGWNNAGDK